MTVQYSVLKKIEENVYVSKKTDRQYSGGILFAKQFLNEKDALNYLIENELQGRFKIETVYKNK